MTQEKSKRKPEKPHSRRRIDLDLIQEIKEVLAIQRGLNLRTYDEEHPFIHDAIREKIARTRKAIGV